MNITEILDTLTKLASEKALEDAGRKFGMTEGERSRAQRHYTRICKEMQAIYSEMSMDDMKALHELRQA